MTTVRDLISRKKSRVFGVSGQARVFEAVEKMVENNVGSLVIFGANNTPVGMFTERDFLRRVALPGRSSALTRLQDVMSIALVFVDMDTTTDECMRLMTHHKIRHLPVVEDGSVVVGMLSMGDIIHNLVSEQESEIRQLTNYIQGAYG